MFFPDNYFCNRKESEIILFQFEYDSLKFSHANGLKLIFWKWFDLIAKYNSLFCSDMCVWMLIYHIEDIATK